MPYLVIHIIPTYLIRKYNTTNKKSISTCSIRPRYGPPWALMGRVLWGKTHPRKPMGGPGLRAIWPPFAGRPMGPKGPINFYWLA
jgi:hypothetical protein